MFAFCFSRLGSHEEADDAVQSTFLNAHRALQRGVTPETELAWLLKIAHNVCLTRRRSTRRRGRVEAAHDLGSMQDYLPAPPRESPDELLRLTDALGELPDSQRRAILLREWQGLSYAEIARELKLTQSAVETLIFRARRSLAANLEMVVGKPRLIARARHALDLGWLLPGLKALFSGGAAVKAATAAVAVSSAAVLATSTDAPTQSARQVSPPAPAGAEQVAAKPAAAVERPRLQERADPVRASRPEKRQAAPVPATPAAVQAGELPASPNVKGKRDHAAVKAKRTSTPKRTAEPKPAKAKKVAAPVRRKRAKPKPKRPEHAAPAPPAEAKAPGPPEKSEPDPGNGKTK